MKITLPIPDRAVSPNARRGQSKKAAIIKAKKVRLHRQRAKVLALEALGNTYHIHGLPVPAFAGYSLVHFFKTAAPRDDDNADGACKAYRDGIADALGIDDSRFVSHPYLRDEVVKGGEVRVRITCSPETGGAA